MGYQFCNIAVVRTCTTALAAKFLRSRTPAKKRQQLVGCTSWRGKTKFVLRRECVSSLAAQRESAKPAELVVQQAFQDFETYFWGGPPFPAMSHEFRCARMTFSESNL